MRPWPVLLLLLVSGCSRPNPLFLDEDADAAPDLSSGTAASSSSEPAGTTAASTLPPVTTTSEATTGAGTTGTTDPTDTTGPVSTTAVGPGCPPFPGPQIAIDLNIPPAACTGQTIYSGKVDTESDPALVALCLAGCEESCGPGLPVDPEIVPYLEHGTCLTAYHEGQLAPGDPEAPSGCKTTAFTLYDDNGPYPLYVASSRVLEPPAILAEVVALEVSYAPGPTCDCDAGDCCLEGQAKFFTLKFSHQGQVLALLGPGEGAVIALGGASYVLEVLRAHAKGYARADDQTCVDDPETQFVDWHMLRLTLP